MVERPPAGLPLKEIPDLVRFLNYPMDAPDLGRPSRTDLQETDELSPTCRLDATR
jgi:hypothetical protein